MAIKSQFYTEEDLYRSSTAKRRGIDNTPPLEVRDNLQNLVRQIIDPICGMLDTKVNLNSVYRCEKLNVAVGGSGTNPGEKPSAHMDGRAVDFTIHGLTSEQLMRVFNHLRRVKLPFDKLIFECGAWIHVQIAAKDNEPRGLTLIATGGPGNWSYVNAPAIPA